MKNKMGNSDLIKRINIANIIEILKSQGMKSRAELAILTGLTPASITKSTKKLIDLNILMESGLGKISSGRPPILLQINPKAGYILGINLAPTKIKGILTDINGNILSEKIFYLENRDKEYILNLLFILIENLKNIVKRERILGIGIAMNGMVDYDHGVSIFSPHYKWKNFNLQKIIEDKFNIPTIIDNDVRAMALGEHKEGAAIHEDNFIIVSVGEGIGAGIILNDKLYRGDNYGAGEIGHLIIETNSSHLCSCGNYGCLEAIIKDIKKKNNNVFSSKSLDDVAENLGYALSFLANFLNPKLIVLVGEFNSDNKKFYQNLKSKIDKYSLATSTTNLKIIPSQLKENAATVGATILVYDNLFKGRKILKV